MGGSRRGSPQSLRVARHMVLAVLVIAASMAARADAAESGTGDWTTSWPGGRWQPGDARYGMVVEQGVPIVMDDGVKLFADIGFPTDLQSGMRAEGEFPVLLTQNPYARELVPDEYFVSRGYIYVVVDIRGTGRTESADGGPLVNTLFSARHAQDGVLAVDWAAHELEGSNGVVGLIGCSYLGITQIFTAAAAGPNSPIKAIVPACASNGYDTYFVGGIGSQTAGLFGAAGAITGQKHLAENAASGKELADDIVAGGPRAYDNAYWQERSTANAAADVVRNGIPALLWSGWDATEITGAMELYSIFQNTHDGRPPFGPMAAGQEVTGRYQIVVGPWTHGEGLDRSLQLQWFDRWLKEDQNGIDETTTPMHLYETGTGRWINAERYPLSSSYSSYYLDGPGSISVDAPTASGADAISWGPPALSGTTLTYDSLALDEAVTIGGPVAATIQVSSSNTNVELIATLYEVAVDGEVTRLTTGALLGSLRRLDDERSWHDDDGRVIRPDHTFEADEPLTPGVPVGLDIKLDPILHGVPAGHSLRLVLSTQTDVADCGISLSEGLPKPRPCLLTAPQQQTLPGGVYEIQRGGDVRSVLNLPLLDPTALSTALSSPTPDSNGVVLPMVWGAPTASVAETDDVASPAVSDDLDPTVSSTDSDDDIPWWMWLVAVGGALGGVLVGVGLGAARRRASA
jgi:predicted acyl esterase